MTGTKKGKIFFVSNPGRNVWDLVLLAVAWGVEFAFQIPEGTFGTIEAGAAVVAPLVRFKSRKERLGQGPWGVFRLCRKSFKSRKERLGPLGGEYPLGP